MFYFQIMATDPFLVTFKATVNEFGKTSDLSRLLAMVSDNVFTFSCV